MEEGKLRGRFLTTEKKCKKNQNTDTPTVVPRVALGLPSDESTNNIPDVTYADTCDCCILARKPSRNPGLES